MPGMTPVLILSIAFGLSFAIAITLVQSEFVRARIMVRRDDLAAPQTMHRSPTPRLGGLAVLAGFALAVLITPSPHAGPLTLLLLAGVPLVLAGALEDLGHRVSPLGRLLAAGISALLAVAMLGIWIPPSGLAPVDAAFAIPAVAILFTVVWVAGVCHGFNLIDGVNGLAGGLATVIAIGLAVVALRAGEPALALAKLALPPALLGFLVLNWPRGRIFLGDAGAYGLGFFLVWLAIVLAWQVPGVSTAALALMFFWPVADTFLAMARRRATGRRMDAPDRLHFHQLVCRLLARALPDRMGRVWLNSLAGACTLALATVPVVVGVLLWNRPLAAIAAWAVFGLLFVAGYRIGVWQLKRRRPKPQPRTVAVRGPGEHAPRGPEGGATAASRGRSGDPGAGSPFGHERAQGGSNDRCRAGGKATTAGSMTA